MMEAEKFLRFVKQGSEQAAQAAPVLIRIEDQTLVVTARCRVEGVQPLDDGKLKHSVSTDREV